MWKVISTHFIHKVKVSPAGISPRYSRLSTSNHDFPGTCGQHLRLLLPLTRPLILKQIWMQHQKFQHSLSAIPSKYTQNTTLFLSTTVIQIQVTIISFLEHWSSIQSYLLGSAFNKTPHYLAKLILSIWQLVTPQIFLTTFHFTQNKN